MKNQRYDIPILVKDLGMMYGTKTSKIKVRFGLYICPSCGEIYKTRTNAVNAKQSKQCRGCSRLIHGLTNSKAYQCLGAIKQRCFNPKDISYKNYGARGITVCDEWLDIFVFKKWFDSNYVNGYEIDRIDNDGNYEPDNCRFVTPSSNMKNRRCSVKNQSEYDNVIWHKKSSKWRARIVIDGNDIHLGFFDDDKEASDRIKEYFNSADYQSIQK